MPLGGDETRVLVTGARGFVGTHLARALHDLSGRVTLIATAKEEGEDEAWGPVTALDVTDCSAVKAAVTRYAPTHVIHLAGIAAPIVATADPLSAWSVHVQGSLNLAYTLLDAAPDCWLMYVGSGLIYGDSARTGLPLDEMALLVPWDEYSATKAAADLALGALTRRGLKCIRFRPFNHTGPGQAGSFVIPAFALQIASIEAGLAPPVIRVGNLDAERDFLDVRDVAEAYALGVQNSKNLVAGTIYNIASGVPRRIGDVLQGLLGQSCMSIAVEQDPSRFRAGELPCIIGSAKRAREQLGWCPRRAFEATLADVLNDCRARVGSG